MRATILLALSERVLGRVRNSPRPLSAKDLARALGASRAEVNSVLYAGVGRLFKIVGEDPPLWECLSSSESESRRLQSFKGLEGVIHIDAPGGDWTLTIAVDRMSVNDPVAVVEPTGIRARLITVSDAVVRNSINGDDVPDAIVAIASSMLSWEIYDALNEDQGIKLDFPALVSKVYLSIGAHCRKSGVESTD
jgi:hypothetical protein